MTTILLFAGAGLASYLLGAIPCGFWVARCKGVDIRKVGSGNIGATNVFRSVGKGWGLLTFFLDAMKGFVPAFVFPLIACRRLGCSDETALSVCCAAGAFVGHNWPVTLGFKGGKGVATITGALLGMAPAAAGFGLVVWAIVFLLSRYVSAASLAAAVAVPAFGAWRYFPDGRVLPVTLIVLGLVVIVRHRGNIRRLLAGTEYRFGRHRENHNHTG